LKARWFFGFFLVSGLCSLVYEIVWLRLAMASFGVTTPIVSMVLSIFMGGLALGSWAAGRIVVRLRQSDASVPLKLYAAAELAIGMSGIVVPPALRLGHAVLARSGSSIEWGSVSHHAASGAWIALVLLPFATAMGTTFPLAMAAIEKLGGAASPRSFSYLYLANVLGATAGTVLAAVFLIEMLGFQGTLWLTASLNALLAAGAFSLSSAEPDDARAELPASDPVREDDVRSGRGTLGLLFLTGLTSMALEVVWIRLLTPYLGTVVYAFAMILTLYLLATFLGSAAYRQGGFHVSTVWLATGCCALLSLAAADSRLGGEGLGLGSLARVLVAVGPFSAAVGFLTPMLVDRWSSGAPDRAGSAYAVNVIGCILGPLLASFVLLPCIGERWTTLTLAAPLFIAGVAATRLRPGRRLAIVGCAVAAAALLTFTRDFESGLTHAEVRRDATATVIAAGEGMDKKLLVNGYGMTVLTTVTKTIAHLPMAFLQEPPRKVLVICFGMGTSFRSALAWDVAATTVELIPSVPGLFGYFHADAAEVLARPGARVVVDDGRRFLERTSDTYDVILIDPPPPVEAAGSSLLYSREFYVAARRRLRAGGILQQWYPGSDDRVDSGVVRAIGEVFPHVRVFKGFQGWGLHLLASDRPIPILTGEALAAKLPPRAAADLVEWEPNETPEGIFDAIVRGEMTPESILRLNAQAPALTDDRPLNEYYLLHRLFD
jgi:spermidine synthase